MMEREEIFSELCANGRVVEYSPDFRNELLGELFLFQEDAGIEPSKEMGIVPLVILRQPTERNNDRWDAVCREFTENPCTSATQGNRCNRIQMRKLVVYIFG